MYRNYSKDFKYFDESLLVIAESIIQCRHLIPALNARVARTWGRTARPVATQSPGHG